MIGVLLSLAGKDGQWVMIFLLTEASKSRLLEQRLLSCKTLLIPASGSLELAGYTRYREKFAKMLQRYSIIIFETLFRAISRVKGIK